MGSGTRPMSWVTWGKYLPFGEGRSFYPTHRRFSYTAGPGPLHRPTEPELPRIDGDMLGFSRETEPTGCMYVCVYRYREI